jgi:hypothetical protein
MNLNESPLDSEIGDFADVLKTEYDGRLPVIVGGHAVGFWSRYYLALGTSLLAEFLPFRSKDLDLVGNAELLGNLQKRFSGKLTRSEPRSPVFGRLDIPQPNGGFLRVEVLHTVLGLSHEDLQRTVELNAAGVVGRIPLPHLVLKAKIANSALISQEGRQDVKHTKMMILCTNAFILEFLEKCQAGLLAERTAINLLDEIREVITTKEAAKSILLWGFDFTEIWPMETLKAFGEGKIFRWVEHRLA